MKKLLLLFVCVILVLPIKAEEPASSDRARGVFFAVGVGPRMPIFGFAEKTLVGYGVNAEFSYADNEILPFFVFGKLAYENFPGSQDYYRETNLSMFSTSYISLTAGARRYFEPMIDEFFLVPLVEVSGTLALYEEITQYKQDTGLPDIVDDGTAFGFSVGAGASMFVLEVMASYNYLGGNHFLLLDLKVRIPLYATI